MNPIIFLSKEYDRNPSRRVYLTGNLNVAKAFRRQFNGEIKQIFNGTAWLIEV